MNTTEFTIDTSDTNIDVVLYNYSKTEFFKDQLPKEHQEFAIDLDLSVELKINWYFYFEMRSWGVKSVGAYATKVSLSYGYLTYIVEVNETITEHEIEVKINLDDFNIESEGELKDGFIQVEDCEIDFEKKEITISFD